MSAGAKLTNEAGVALESIFTSVELQAKEIENINLMAAQQLQSSSTVVQIIRAITSSTQQSNMSTRDASQNMERLARLVEQLRSSVEAFKLRENQNYLVPSANVTSLDHSDNQMSVSSVLRAVTFTPIGPNPGMAGKHNTMPLAPAHPSDPFSFYPITPNQPQNDPWSAQQQQSAIGESINEPTSNSNRKK